jgi:hypothetical protein
MRGYFSGRGRAFLRGNLNNFLGLELSYLVLFFISMISLERFFTILCCVSMYVDSLSFLSLGGLVTIVLVFLLVFFLFSHQLQGYL